MGADRVKGAGRLPPFRSPRELVFFGWPSSYGGADTKAAHLLPLLSEAFRITVVPNNPQSLRERVWTDYLGQFNIRCALASELPARLEGVALAMCNDIFFATQICQRARARGLLVVWSSEMMWYHEGEREAIERGEVDRLLYVSAIQQSVLNYESFCEIPTRMTGNYVDPNSFPFTIRNAGSFTVGRLSRADADKYPEDFPVFYEALDLRDARFRVMAWSNELREKYRWHHFDERWELLSPAAEPTAKFLSSLDLFIYPLGHRFTESWGRSTVEAMLTGAIPLVPPGHNFDQLIVHGETGFICDDFRAYRRYAQLLRRNHRMRRAMSLNCRRHAVENLCHRETHLRVWREALNV